VNQRAKVKTYLDYLYERDFKERPVTIKELLCGDKYFGSLTNSGKLIYPIWHEKLTEISEEDSKYLIILTGAIGTGKTSGAVFGAADVMQKLLCLKDPWGFFGLSGGRKMSIVFFNLTKSLSETRAFGILQSHLLASEWFRGRPGAVIKGRAPDQRIEFPLFEYTLASPYAQGFGIIGADVVMAIMDEVDAPGVSKQQRVRVLQAYETAVRRFESRFVNPVYKETLGKFFLVASKQAELSFLQTFIAQRKNSPSVFVVDLPFWITKTKGALSGRTFAVMVGDVYVPSRIVTSVAEKRQVSLDGHQILDVPIEFYDAFDLDIKSALRDIAGISVAEMRRFKLFASEKIVAECYDDTKECPVSKTTIEIGLEDSVDLVQFVDFTKLRMPRSVVRYIHLDVAYSGEGDALGIAMSGVSRWERKEVEQADGTFQVEKVPVVETDFAFRLKGKPGDQIPLHKVRRFVLDIRALGYTIGKLTADLALLSEDTRQILTRAGINCDYLSLDRETKPYLLFKELVDQGRWVCYRDEFINFELVNLEYDRDKKKIDHPDKVANVLFLPDGGVKEVVLTGSKDIADGIAGSVFDALEGANVIPVDKEDVVAILKRITERKVEKENEYWWLGRDKAFASSEQYVLLDSSGKFWHWFRKSPDATPTLKGPFKKKPVDVEVVKVKSARGFYPGQSTEKKMDAGQTAKFLDVLRSVREKS